MTFWMLALAGQFGSLLVIGTCLAAVFLPVRYHTVASRMFAFMRSGHESSFSQTCLRSSEGSVVRRMFTPLWSALAPSDICSIPRVGESICSLLAIIGGCPSAGILSIASAVFHVAFEGAAQSYTSLPSCSIASKATMLTADEGRFRKDSRSPNAPAPYAPTLFNCEQLHHGAGSIFISLCLHSSSTSFWFRQQEMRRLRCSSQRVRPAP